MTNHKHTDLGMPWYWDKSATDMPPEEVIEDLALLAESFHELGLLDRSRRIAEGWLTPTVVTAFDRIDGRAFQRPQPDKLRCISYFPPEETRIVIVGQDPYPTAGKANGLAFGVSPTYPRPLEGSLGNIARAIRQTTGLELSDYSLESWARQGVLLINRVLSVKPGAAYSDYNYGWQAFTDALIEEAAVQAKPVFFIWGNAAGEVTPIAERHGCKVYRTVHPSPRSVNNTFMKSTMFADTKNLVKWGEE